MWYLQEAPVALQPFLIRWIYIIKQKCLLLGHSLCIVALIRCILLVSGLQDGTTFTSVDKNDISNTRKDNFFYFRLNLKKMRGFTSLLHTRVNISKNILCHTVIHKFQKHQQYSVCQLVNRLRSPGNLRGVSGDSKLTVNYLNTVFKSYPSRVCRVLPSWPLFHQSHISLD